MKYYVCIALPKVEEKKAEINWFITYSFGDNNGQYNDYKYGYKEYDFTVGKIYQTMEINGESIMDDSSNVYKLKDIMEYLEPFEFKIDEDALRLIEIKKAKGDEVKLLPICFREIKGQKILELQCNCAVVKENGMTLFTSMYFNYNISQRNAIIKTYRSIRESGKLTSNWRSYLFQLECHGKIKDIYK